MRSVGPEPHALKIRLRLSCAQRSEEDVRHWTKEFLAQPKNYFSQCWALVNPAGSKIPSSSGTSTRTCEYSSWSAGLPSAYCHTSSATQPPPCLTYLSKRR